MSTDRPWTLGRAATLLSAGASIVGGMVALTPLIESDRVRMLLGACAAAAMVAAVLVDRSAARQEAAIQAKRTQERIAEMLRESVQTDFSLSVRGGSWLREAIFFLVLGGLVWLLGPAGRTFVIELSSILMLTVGLLLALQWLGGVGKPVLVLSHSSLWTPHSGAIPWNAVEGLYLEEQRSRGSVLWRTLAVRVPTLLVYRAQFSLFYRLVLLLQRKRGRSSMRVLLRGTSESATLIDALARHLWTAKTGRTDVWFPGMPEEEVQAYRALETIHRQYVLQPSKLVEQVQDPAKAAAMKAQVDQGLETLGRAQRRRARTVWVLTIVATVAAVVAVALRAVEWLAK